MVQTATYSSNGLGGELLRLNSVRSSVVDLKLSVILNDDHVVQHGRDLPFNSTKFIFRECCRVVWRCKQTVLFGYQIEIRYLLVGYDNHTAIFGILYRSATCEQSAR